MPENINHLPITEDMILRHVTQKVFDRGEEYFQNGSVDSLVLRGTTLAADVEGSDYEPYRVTVTFDADGVTAAGCTCPYGAEWGGWCKHIVAVLLAAMNEPDTVKERPGLDSVLAGLDADQLRGLLLRMVARDPALADAVEAQASLLAVKPAIAGTAASAPTTTRPAPLDPEPLRRQVKASLRSLRRLRSSDAYWQVSAVVNEVRGVLTEVEPLLAAGDARSALTALEAITEAYLADWTDLDDSDGEASYFFRDLDETWAEALLLADLTPKERREWGKKFEEWHRDVEDYGVDEGFLTAADAAQTGWDDPRLIRILNGDAVGDAEENGLEDYRASRLNRVRLDVLERQGRTKEYLRLADAEGEWEQAAAMRITLGRTKEAMTQAMEHLAMPDQALDLARLLQAQGETEEAIRLAEHGLTREGRKASLALWLRDLARERGDSELALRSAIIAFGEAPQLADYGLIQTLAGAQWAALRESLLSRLRLFRSYDMIGAVDVFLAEGLTDDALAAVRGVYDAGLVGRVVDAAAETHPKEVIPICRRRAETIMDEGKSGHYDEAALWLARAKIAYRADGREKEWKDYFAELLSKHQKKYKLMPLLRKL